MPSTAGYERRVVGSAPEQKAPAVAEDLRAMADACHVDTKVGLRDRAMPLFGLAGALRRSELVALTTADVIDDVDRGVAVKLRRSKINVSSLSLNLIRAPILLSANASRKGAPFASRGVLVIEPLHHTSGQSRPSIFVFRSTNGL